MSDRMFEGSLTGLTALVVSWIILGIVFGIMGWLLVVLIGLVVEIVGGRFLLHHWGKSYMAKE